MSASPFRELAKRIPGLAAAVRGARARWWRLRAALPLGPRGKRRLTSYWGQAVVSREGDEGLPRGWLDSPQVLHEYVFPRFGGRDWFTYLREEYGSCATCLSLCCGDGAVERNLLQAGVCRTAEGIDISAEAVAHCRRLAADLPELCYRVGDLERLSLPAASYDLAVGWMGLHHLARLARVLDAVAASLRPEGLFVVNEYVGPVRFQLPEAQVELINDWLARLPADLRRTRAGAVKERYQPESLADLISRDPSEAIISDQIISLVAERFTVVARMDYGGGLLHWLLADIIHNFSPESAEHNRWLQQLYAAERDAMAAGGLANNFSFLVARKRG